MEDLIKKFQFHADQADWWLRLARWAERYNHKEWAEDFHAEVAFHIHLAELVVQQVAALPAVAA